MSNFSNSMLHSLMAAIAAMLLLTDSSSVNGYSLQEIYSWGRMPIDITPSQDDRYDWGGHVIVVEGKYQMWWTRYAAVPGQFDTIWYAESTDGLHWYNGCKVLVPAESDQEKMHVADPSVVKVADVYYMFYEAGRVVAPQEAESQIFLATSSDGINWNKYPSNSNPQPVMGWPCDHSTNPNHGKYGLGMPSVHYRDGQFHMYYLTSFDWPDQIRVAHSSDPYNWGNFETHPVVAYGAAADVKYNKTLNQYIMVYTIIDSITPNPAPVTTYGVYAFTSPNGLIWNGYNKPYLWTISTQARNLALGLPQPRTRAFATLAATDQYGCMDHATMMVVFMEGDMHPLNQDWKIYHPTWNLHSLLFKFDNDAQPLVFQDGVVVRDTQENWPYKIGYQKRCPFLSWDVYYDSHAGRLNDITDIDHSRLSQWEHFHYWAENQNLLRPNGSIYYIANFKYYAYKDWADYLSFPGNGPYLWTEIDEATFNIMSSDMKGAGYRSEPLIDLNGDGEVNVFDVAVLASQWLCREPALLADYNNDFIVDVDDFMQIVHDWLMP